MPVYKAEAIVLRQQTIGEADRVVTLLTREYGKLRAVARGIRRPTSRLGGRVEPFTHVRLLLARGRTLDVIAQADVVGAFAGLRDDLTRFAYASYVAELVDRFLPERDRHESVFDLVQRTLEDLDGAGEEEVELSALWFALRLAADLGYRPETAGCVECGRPLPQTIDRTERSWAFSPALGGALCPACAGKDPGAKPVAPGVLAISDYLLRLPDGRSSRLRIPTSQRRELARLVQAHLEHRLEGRLRAPAVIGRLQNPQPDRGTVRVPRGGGHDSLPEEGGKIENGGGPSGD